MDDKENVAEVSFWVDSSENLLGEPTVTKPAADTALGESGINAIKLAHTFSATTRRIFTSGTNDFLWIYAHSINQIALPC